MEVGNIANGTTKCSPLYIQQEYVGKKITASQKLHSLFARYFVSRDERY